MMSNKLINIIKGEGLSVQRVVNLMSTNYHINMDKSTFYKKMKDVEQFRGGEIKAIAAILGLSYNETGRVFFQEEVS